MSKISRVYIPIMHAPTWAHRDHNGDRWVDEISKARAIRKSLGISKRWECRVQDWLGEWRTDMI